MGSRRFVSCAGLALLAGILLFPPASGRAAVDRLASTNSRAIALYREGLDLAGADRFTEAIDKLKLAILADSNFIQAHLRYMDAFQGVGRGDEVVEMYRHKSEQNPENPIYHYLYGRALKDMPAKRAEFYKAFQCDSLFYWAPYGIGGSYFMENNPDQAAIYLNRALEINPQMVDAVRLLGQVYLQKEMLYQAKDLFETAIRLDSLDAVNYIQLGKTLSQMERTESAEKAFRQATAVSPKDPEPWFYIGLLGEIAGDTLKAVAAYQKFLELAPEDNLAPLVRNNLQKLKKPGGR